jgi:hypothetical protein
MQNKNLREGFLSGLVEIKFLNFVLNLFILYKKASKEVERVERLAAVPVVPASNHQRPDSFCAAQK